MISLLNTSMGKTISLLTLFQGLSLWLGLILSLTILSTLQEALVVDPKLEIIVDLCIVNQAPNPNYSVHDHLFRKG